MLVACSNCVNEGVRGWEYGVAWLVGLAALLAAVAFVAVAVRVAGVRRFAAAVAALGLGIAPLATLFLLSSEARPPDWPPNWYCGGALDASRLRGWPTDDARDPGQVSCQVAGQRQVDRAKAVAALGLGVGLPAGVLPLVRRRAQPPTLDHPPRALSPTT